MAVIVGISGNIARPSRTRFLLERVLARAAERGLGATACYDVVDAGPALGTATSRAAAPPELDRVWSAIETCDALVVATPVYKAAYSGLFKHLFDLIDKDALRDRPVLLAATGRLPQYGFVIEHHLRPLFGFFECATVPGGVYACDADFERPDALRAGFDAQIAAAVERLRRAMAGAAA